MNHLTAGRAFKIFGKDRLPGLGNQGESWHGKMHGIATGIEFHIVIQAVIVGIILFRMSSKLVFLR